MGDPWGVLAWSEAGSDPESGSRLSPEGGGPGLELLVGWSRPERRGEGFLAGRGEVFTLIQRFLAGMVSQKRRF